MTTPTSPRILLFFSAPFILVGILGVGWGTHGLVQGLRCKSWPHVEGIVTAAEMTMQPGSGDTQDTYGGKVSYDYQVGGKYYSAERLSFGDYTSGSTGHAQSILNRYRPGSKVVVYYSPADPENAVLETGIHPGVWVGIGVGGIMLASGGLIIAIYRLGTNQTRAI